ncbi:Terminase-like family [Neorhizobium galegae bv. orientalis]|nr:Terminase-like family [Neorhizobium galegae bv. orientalis]
MNRGLRTITAAREEYREAITKSTALSDAIGQGNAGRDGSSISPLVGEMSPEVTEGGGAANSTVEECADTPPSALPGISPTRGEIGQPQQPDTSLIGFTLRHERDWDIKGRRDQKPPSGDWRTWLIMGGRGSGKTRAGAEWIHGLASAGSRSQLRIALVAETLGDAREVMIDGVSGICRVARSKRPDFEIPAGGWSGRTGRSRRSFPRKTRRACAARSFISPGATSSPNGGMRRKPSTCCSSGCGSGPIRASW